MSGFPIREGMPVVAITTIAIVEGGRAPHHHNSNFGIFSARHGAGWSKLATVRFAFPDGVMAGTPGVIVAESRTAVAVKFFKGDRRSHDNFALIVARGQFGALCEVLDPQTA